MKCDVLVIGGGAAGVAAAYAAAKQDAKVILTEKQSFLGGMATGALVGTICGLHHCQQEKPKLGVSGFAAEFALRLSEKSRTLPIAYKNLTFLPYDPFAFRLLCDHYLKESDTEVLFDTVVYDVQRFERQIDQVFGLRKNQKIKITPSQVIDATGFPLVSDLTGTTTIADTRYQDHAYTFSLCGFPQEWDEHTLNLAFFRQLGRCSKTFGISLLPGSFRQGRAYFKLALPWQPNNDNEPLARQILFELMDTLASQPPPYNQLTLGEAGTFVGERTNRRTQGRTTLQRQQVLEAASAKNSIARGLWPIEQWFDGNRPRLEFLPPGKAYGIPAEALYANDLDNLFVAGRNISADSDAIASARVIGTALQTGYAAGYLAAARAKKIHEEKAIDELSQLQGKVCR